MVLNGHEILVLLAGVLGGGFVTSIVAQIVKKIVGLEKNAVIHTMVLAVAGAATYAQYIISMKSSLPPTILGISGTAIYGFSQIVFKYSSYFGDFIGKVNAYNQAQIAKTTVIEPTVKSENTASTTTPPSAPFTL